MTSPDPGDLPSALPVIERKIGATHFTVVAHYSQTATENAVKKMRRILLKEAVKNPANPHK